MAEHETCLNNAEYRDVELGSDDDRAEQFEDSAAILAKDLKVDAEVLKVDVEDLININSFSKAKEVKPVIHKEGWDHKKLMPYFQVATIVFTLLCAIFLILGYYVYKTKEGDPKSSKADGFKYAGFTAGICAISCLIACIYIKSVTENNLAKAMQNFRKSRMAHPDIDKKLQKGAHKDHHHNPSSAI